MRRAVLLSLLLAACGQSGDLYLPEAQAPGASPPARPPAAAPPAADAPGPDDAPETDDGKDAR